MIALSCFSLSGCLSEDQDDELGLGSEGEDFGSESLESPAAADSELEAELRNAVKVHQEELARIEIENGEIVFFVDVDGPAEGQVTMLEALRPDENGNFSGLVEELSPLEAFVKLTEGDVPVPQALFESEEEALALELVGARPLTANGSQSVPAAEDRLSAVVEPLQWSAVRMCNEGGTSREFKDEICPIYEHWTLNFCHAGTWHSVTDDTGTSNKSEWAQSQTLACNANGRVRHYYKFWGVWYEGLDNPIPSGNLYRYRTKGKTTVKLHRAIKHSRTASGFVRGTSSFFAFPF